MFQDMAGSLEAFLEEVTANLGLGRPGGESGSSGAKQLQYDEPSMVGSQHDSGLISGQGSPGPSPSCLCPGPLSQARKGGPFHHQLCLEMGFPIWGRKKLSLPEPASPMLCETLPHPLPPSREGCRAWRGRPVSLVGLS